MEHAIGLHQHYDQARIPGFNSTVTDQEEEKELDPTSNTPSKANPLAYGYYEAHPWGLEGQRQSPRRPVRQRENMALYSPVEQRYVEYHPRGKPLSADPTSMEPSYDNPMLRPGFRRKEVAGRLQ